MISQICEKLANKKILLLGYGKEGKSTYHFIRKHFPDMVIGIYDKNAVKDQLEHVVLHSGSSYEDILADYDIIIKSPGIVFHSKNNKELKKLTSQTDLYLEFYRDQTIGITGTKGKSTTTSLLYHILRTAKKDVILAGNIGIPVFDVLEEITKDSLVVYELSSHQLEYVTYSPHIGLHLNIYQEHLDHYGTFEKYAAAKENIYKFQQKGGLLFYNKEFLKPEHAKADLITISNTSEEADVIVKENLISYQDSRIEINEDEILLIGQHNIYNIAAAYCIVRNLGVTDEEFCEALKTFRPLPHRLEYVAEVNGVKYYNDSISTVCETAIQAVKSVKNVDTVILGGMDRGIEYQPLVDFLMESDVRNFILMPDTGIRIKNLIMSSDKKEKLHNLFMVQNVEEAVAVAKKETPSGKTCLFSPAAASYGFFKNFEERGEVFKRSVLNN
ncbi:MAG TPA: UDP-N-acetylmuramoyl-L-alanine--D-glutamate ligase [Mobilitalea sp.]|nr:UDP-N-acetylmuramoyl-L-alanine--D-glutamate ligase [Mobilitalea sp.]